MTVKAVYESLGSSFAPEGVALMRDGLVNAPLISVRLGLPEAEHSAGYSVQANLHMLETQIRDFLLALQLYNFCISEMERIDQQCKPGESPTEQQLEADRVLSGWLGIAGRDGAMTIYHFGTAVEGVRRALSMCPTLSKIVLHQELRQAIRDFHSAFPTYEKMRHAVAHAAEKNKTPEHATEHGVFPDHVTDRTNKRGLTISNFFNGRRFTNTWEGQVLIYELSQASLEKLNDTAKAIFAAFREAIYREAKPTPP